MQKKKTIVILIILLVIISAATLFALIVGNPNDNPLDSEQGAISGSVADSTTEPSEKPEREWEVFHVLEEFGSPEVELGTIKLSPFLYQAIMSSTDANEVFHIEVVCVGRSGEQDLRKDFILRQDVKEAEPERTLRVTREELDNLRCVEGMAIVLQLENEIWNGLTLTEDTIKLFGEDVVEIFIVLREPEEVGVMWQELTSIGLSVYQIGAQVSAYQEKKIDEFLEDYQIETEDVVYRHGGGGGIRLRIMMNQETMHAMIKDERIEHMEYHLFEPEGDNY